MLLVAKYGELSSRSSSEDHSVLRAQWSTGGRRGSEPPREPERVDQSSTRADGHQEDVRGGGLWVLRGVSLLPGSSYAEEQDDCHKLCEGECL